MFFFILKLSFLLFVLVPKELFVLHENDIDDLTSWDFPYNEVITVEDKIRVSWAMFHLTGFVDKLRIDKEVFQKFLLVLQYKYDKRDNPFHNFQHAIAGNIKKWWELLLLVIIMLLGWRQYFWFILIILSFFSFLSYILLYQWKIPVEISGFHRAVHSFIFCIGTWCISHWTHECVRSSHSFKTSDQIQRWISKIERRKKTTNFQKK